MRIIKEKTRKGCNVVLNGIIKNIIVLFVSVVYAAVTYSIFKFPITMVDLTFVFWLASVFLIAGMGLKLTTNKLFDSFILGYLMFSLAGLLLVFGVGAKVISLPSFHKEAYSGLINVDEVSFEDYSMGKSDFDIMSETRAKNIMLDKLAESIQDVSDIILSSGRLQVIGNKFCYAFVVYNRTLTNCIGFAYVDVNTEDAVFNNELMVICSPNIKGKQSINSIIRNEYYSDVLADTYLEFDDEENPYWITYCYGSAVSISGKRSISDIYITNPFTANVTKYTLAQSPNWLDYKVDMSIYPDLANTSLKYKGLDYKIDSNNYAYILRNKQVYAYSNLKSLDDEKGLGMAFINMSSGDIKVYSTETVTFDRAIECVNAWEIASDTKAKDIPMLVNVDNNPTFVSAMLDEDGKVNSYLIIDGIKGSYYVSNTDWNKMITEFKSGVNTEKPEEQEEKNNENSEKHPVQNTNTNNEIDLQDEGITFNLIAGIVDNYVLVGNEYVVTMVAIAQNYYISADLISAEALEQAKINGLALQYPIEYDGQKDVKGCVPVSMSVVS